MSKQPRKPQDVLGALLEERRKYESWIEALDARRASTPAHVFARVHADYESRLANVIDQLGQHQDDLATRANDLDGQLANLIVRLDQLRDERAEQELRAHVGELDAAGFEDARREIDETIAHAEKEKATTEAEIGRLRQLLSSAAAPMTAVAPLDAAPDADETSAPAAPEVAPATPPAIEAAPPDDGKRSLTPSNSFDELAFLKTIVGEEERVAAESKQSQAPAAPPAAPAKEEAAPPRKKRLVETPAAPVVPVTSAPRRNSIAREELEDTPLLSSALADETSDEESPLAANITGNHPIVLSASDTLHTKTLKCAECGAMNYPTEWYCERCGGELAAL